MNNNFRNKSKPKNEENVLPKLYNPFAEKIETTGLKNLSSLGESTDFVWKRTTYLRGLLQKTVVIRREDKK